MHSALIFSIKQKYAEMIFSGMKTVELRKIMPKALSHGTTILVYVPSPSKCLIGMFRVKKVVGEPVRALWDSVNQKAGLSYEEFSTYYNGSTKGIGIFIEKAVQFQHPLSLNQLKNAIYDFHPPQGFRYVTNKEIEKLNILLSDELV